MKSILKNFVNDTRSVGISLIVCTLISLLLANSSLGSAYIHLWEAQWHLPKMGIALPHSFGHVINDVLMAIFFLVVGIEIRMEMVQGALSNVRLAILPIFAAIGGMIVPALIYFVINKDSGFLHGWGVPMATDIAFSLGVLSLLKTKTPIALKVLLTALAIIDDLGAIIAIALFYTNEIKFSFLLGGMIIWMLMFVCNKKGMHSMIVYLILGTLLWLCLFNSGVHATLAGVMTAFTIPFKKSENLVHKFHLPVNFIILPLFALANTAIILPNNILASIQSPISMGVMSGLVIGKPLGIILFCFIAVTLGWAIKPQGLLWKHIFGMGLIAGIGFTMSIFISMMAFTEAAHQNSAKIAVLIASLLSALLGFFYLKFVGDPLKNKSIIKSN